MDKTTLDFNSINSIIKKITETINDSRGHILEIVDNVRGEYNSLKMELSKIKYDVTQIINEVEVLEKQDKIMRRKLAEVSKNFHIYTEADIKAAYDGAYEVRMILMAKKNEEKELIRRRSSIEIALKRAMENIQSAEKIINQISIALGYLEGDVSSFFQDSEHNSQMLMGIKILEAQENERKRIARDVHDGPAQYMANAIMKVDICKILIQRNLEDGMKELNDLKESVRLALTEVRGIIFNLRPMSLDDLGLNETIKETTRAINLELGININLQLKPIKDEIDPIIQVAVYRIVQEICNNIKKHAKAENIDIKFDFGIKYLILQVSDDGVGFDVEETLRRAKTKEFTYGLVGIYDRVKQLQGKISIKSSKGNGTCYIIKLPINREVMKDETGCN